MLSIVINVKNGEKYLVRVLNSLTKFNEIVLFDNYSTDRTIEIAKAYPNVKIVQEPFCGMGKVRNNAAKHTTNDWILAIDCDEIIHPELTKKILSMKFSVNTVYQVLRYNFYDNYKIDGASWENDWVARIYNKTATQFSESDVHESLNTKNQHIERIHDGFIYHFPYDAVAQLIDKMQFYSSLYAKQNLGRKNPKLFSIPVRAFMMFLKCYLLKRGFRFGYEGFIISCYNSIGVFSKYIKLYELIHKCKLGLFVKINSHKDAVKLIQYINHQTLLPNFIWISNENLIEDEFEVVSQLIKHDLIIQSEIIINDSNLTIDKQIRGLNNTNLVDKVIYCEIEKLSNIQALAKIKQAIKKAQVLPIGCQVY